MALAHPATEVPLSEVESNWIGFEPPGFFAQDQNSWFGTFRKVITDYLQAILEQMDSFYVNLGIGQATEEFLQLWEAEYGVPVAPPGLTIPQRRAVLLGRLQKGAFTRPKRDNLIRSFINAAFGEPLMLVPDGVELVPGGVELHNEFQDQTTGLEFVPGGLTLDPGGLPLSGAALFNVLEHVATFAYDVRILNTVTVDVVSLTRELARITPASITFTVTSTTNIYV